jgi:hypothetical protein
VDQSLNPFVARNINISLSQWGCSLSGFLYTAYYAAMRLRASVYMCVFLLLNERLDVPPPKPGEEPSADRLLLLLLLLALLLVRRGVREGGREAIDNQMPGCL